MTTVEDVPLSWAKGDIEQRLGVRGGRHTRVNNTLSVVIALILTLVFYASLIPFQGSHIVEMFTHRGMVQYFTVFFTAWSFTILFLKWQKLALQRQSLKYSVLPTSPDFVLSTATVDQVVGRIYATVDDPKQFVLFNRIMIALSNLRNLGRVSDVDDILRSQAEHDEASMETSYSLVQGFVWAIPVLGFIGTVIGLSNAIGSFSGVLSWTAPLWAVIACLRIAASWSYGKMFSCDCRTDAERTILRRCCMSHEDYARRTVKDDIRADCSVREEVDFVSGLIR